MHGNYVTPGIDHVTYTGAETIYFKGLTLSLVDANAISPHYQTRLTEADFAKFVLSQTNEKPNERAIPAITVQGIAWWHAETLGQWVGNLPVKTAELYVHGRQATLEKPSSGEFAADPFADVKAQIAA